MRGLGTCLSSAWHLWLHRGTSAALAAVPLMRARVLHRSPRDVNYAGTLGQVCLTLREPLGSCGSESIARKLPYFGLSDRVRLGRLVCHGGCPGCIQQAAGSAWEASLQLSHLNCFLLAYLSFKTIVSMCKYVCGRVCTYIRIYVYMYICGCIYTHTHVYGLCVNAHMCV